MGGCCSTCCTRTTAGELDVERDRVAPSKKSRRAALLQQLQQDKEIDRAGTRLDRAPPSSKSRRTALLQQLEQRQEASINEPRLVMVSPEGLNLDPCLLYSELSDGKLLTMRVAKGDSRYICSIAEPTEEEIGGLAQRFAQWKQQHGLMGAKPKPLVARWHQAITAQEGVTSDMAPDNDMQARPLRVKPNVSSFISMTLTQRCATGAGMDTGSGVAEGSTGAPVLLSAADAQAAPSNGERHCAFPYA